VIDQWKQRAVPPLHAYLTEMPTPPARPAVLVLVRLLLQKHTALLRKDTTYLLGRMILFFMLLTLYGIYLVDARQRHQEDVLLIFYSSYFAFIQVMAMSISIFLAMVERWPSFHREIRTGMYGPTAYWLASTLLGIPVAVFTVLVGLVIYYILLDLSWASFPAIWMLLSAVNLWFDALNEFCAFFGRATGTAIAGALSIHCAFSMGIFLNIDRIPWPLRVFSYILPGRFFVEAALARVFGESDDFSGAVRLADATSTELSSANAQIALEYNRTFFCPQSDTVCYASTGRDILNELHAQYAIADPNVQWGVNLAYILAQWAVLRLIGYAKLVSASYSSQGSVQGSTHTGSPSAAPDERSALLKDHVPAAATQAQVTAAKTTGA